MSSPIEKADEQGMQLERWRMILRDSTKEVFSMMVGAEVSSPENDSNRQTEITGMIGLAGALCGVMTIQCSARSAAQITSQMLNVDIKEASKHQSDAIGEMCNMIAGNFKAKIPNLEDKCMLSVPTVITGPDYEIHSIEVGDKIELPLIFAEEPIWITLEVRS
jgi:chemotaxis protein CheX